MLTPQLPSAPATSLVYPPTVAPALLSQYSLTTTSSTLPGPNWHIVIHSRSRAILHLLLITVYPCHQVLPLFKVYNIMFWHSQFHCWICSHGLHPLQIPGGSCIPGDVGPDEIGPDVRPPLLLPGVLNPLACYVAFLHKPLPSFLLVAISPIAIQPHTHLLYLLWHAWLQEF